MASNIPDKPQFWQMPHLARSPGVSPCMPEEPVLPVVARLLPEVEELRPVGELTVLPADEPHRKKLNWVFQEYSGVELHPIIDGKPGPEPVPMTEDLVVGRDYTAIGLMGEHIRWTVEKDSYGELSISNGSSLIGCLQRGGDDRNCWVVTGMINTRGLKRLMVNTDSKD
jgi:hypothetical protein